MEADFAGYATKAGLKCSDGRTITAEAFKHMDGMTVPLVWQHGHSDPTNVLGHAVLEARPDGMYAYGFFNDTEKGRTGQKLVHHKDIRSLSIYANSLVEKSKSVLHGMICEVSLVLRGANPGALIDQVKIQHSDDPDDVEVLEDEAIIHTGLELEFDEDEDEDLAHAEDDDVTLEEIYDDMTDEEKSVVHYLVGAALEAAAAKNSVAQSAVDSTTNNEGDLAHQEGTATMPNVFEKNSTESTGKTLSHSEIAEVLGEAQKTQASSLKAVLKEAALAHGITDIELLFPEAKTVTDDPQFISRKMEWVSSVLDGTKKAPFAKIKTLLADITADEARAKGYVKGNLKTEEVLTLLRRTTGPATIYKKQKLDRDDIVDITDMDVVTWLWAEMNVMMKEEVARAILVGDGRSNLSPDKIKDPAGAVDGIGIRSILNEDDLYAIKVDLAANVSPKDAIKGLVRARGQYRGTGKPTLFISDAFLTDCMLEEDKFGRRLYETEAALRDVLRVAGIVTVDLLEEHPGLFAIMVNLADYTIGANRGGELTKFEDFDIDYNQYKYLIETRLSGALTKPFSAVIVRRSAGTLATATAPSFNGTTDDITIPTVTGVYYTIGDDVVTGTVHITGPTEVEAHPADGYYLAPNSTRSWTYAP